MSFTHESALNRAIRRLNKLCDSAEHEQLAVYVGNVTLDKLTDKERGRPPEQGDDCYLLGYDAASALPIERLRQLFEEDDWGLAWETFKSEQTEWYEQDEGRVMAYRDAIRILEEEAANT